MCAIVKILGHTADMDHLGPGNHILTSIISNLHVLRHHRVNTEMCSLPGLRLAWPHTSSLPPASVLLSECFSSAFGSAMGKVKPPQGYERVEEYKSRKLIGMGETNLVHEY